MKKWKLTKEEKELLASVERGEWRSKKITPEEMEKIRAAAKYTLDNLKKDARLNIRISFMDLQNLRRRASEEGLPYQTFVSSLLHKYVSGRLVEVKK